MQITYFNINFSWLCILHLVANVHASFLVDAHSSDILLRKSRMVEEADNEQWDTMCLKVCAFCGTVLLRRISALCYKECPWYGPSLTACLSYYLDYQRTS